MHGFVRQDVAGSPEVLLALGARSNVATGGAGDPPWHATGPRATIRVEVLSRIILSA
jgi:hypothetical protein